jgi:hypothetical protein
MVFSRKSSTVDVAIRFVGGIYFVSSFSGFKSFAASFERPDLTDKNFDVDLGYKVV